MAISFGEAKKLLSPWAGKGGLCANTKEVDLFVREVLQYLLISGSHGGVRKFCFNAVKGCFTIPYELETPIKVKIDGEVGSVWNKWFEYHSVSELSDCIPANKALAEDPNYFATVYDIPAGGARIGALATAHETDDASIIISGKDTSGRDIYSNHNGTQYSGEYLRLRFGELRYSQVTFGAVTAVKKTPTNGYVQLYWVKPESNMKGFLADYSPLEEVPQYRRFKITSPSCSSCVRVSVLGRVRLKERYADNDIIPFVDNLYALSVAGQAINAQHNGDVESAAAKDKMMQELIVRDAEYKRVQPGTPLEVYVPTSAGAIKGIVSR